ncbi:hypothetical protein [Hyphomonas sp.]|uniref:hypothetical protein n=1 Tax=Hyphomonas sp. TaxID=87 RepID=UPI0025BBDD7D|nr:hypothetical protein [Hyphomonas sp.]
MSHPLNGRDALALLDNQVSRLRQSMAAAIADADGVEARRGAIQREQAAAYGALAAMRLDLMQAGGDGAEFGRLEAAARALTERHAAFVAAEKAALETAEAALGALEAKRAQLAARHDAAVETYESRVAEAEASLKGSAAYTALVEAAEEARAVTQRAGQKLELARNDRTEKGAPYEQDPLFSYLWKRRFRSPEYKAGGVIRMLDSWVAKLCRYDQAFLNYQRLTELPDRIAEHAVFVAGLEDKAEAALVEAEERAMREAGIEALQGEADLLKAGIAVCDGEIAAAEEAHRAMAQRHEAALKEEAGPAVEARELLAAELRKASFPDLRILTAETVELEDDRLVDALVRLRAEEISLDLEAGKRLVRPGVLREDLARMEALRRQFKEARFDSPYALMSRAAFDEMMSNLMKGDMDVRDTLRGLSRSVRRAEPQAHPDFGGRSRQDTIGLPDIMGGVIGGILGEVLEEVIKETTRGSGGYGSGPIFPGPPKRPSRSSSSGGRSFPSGGGRSGHGGRRGGGFKTGGGF